MLVSLAEPTTVGVLREDGGHWRHSLALAAAVLLRSCGSPRLCGRKDVRVRDTWSYFQKASRRVFQTINKPI